MEFEDSIEFKESFVEPSNGEMQLREFIENSFAGGHVTRVKPGGTILS